jgi:hypothetical protein
MSSLRFFTICFVCVAFISGCGREKNTVILPGEDYQLTEEEQAYKDSEDRMRQEGN